MADLKFTNNTFNWAGSELPTVVTNAVDFAKSAYQLALDSINYLNEGQFSQDDMFRLHWPSVVGEAIEGDIWWDGTTGRRYSALHGLTERTNLFPTQDPVQNIDAFYVNGGEAVGDYELDLEDRTSVRYLHTDTSQEFRAGIKATLQAKTYTASFSLISTHGTAMRSFTLHFGDQSKAILLDSPTTPERVYITATVSAGEHNIYVTPGEGEEPVAGDVVYLGAFMIEEGNTQGVFFDGDSVTGSWSGAAGNSISHYAPGWIESSYIKALVDIVQTTHIEDGYVDIYSGPETPPNPSLGDLWEDDAYNLFSWDGSTWKALVDSNDPAIIEYIQKSTVEIGEAIEQLAGIEGQLDGISHIFYQSTPPDPEMVGVGDVWIDISVGKVMKRWDGDSWELIDDERIKQALEEVSGKITSYYQAAAPTGGEYAVGDLWFETDNHNKLYRWDGENWVDASDTRLATFEAELSDVLDDLTGYQGQLDGKATVYFQEADPTTTETLTADDKGDVWIKPSTDEFKSWDGTAWVLITDPKALDALEQVEYKTTTYFGLDWPTAPEFGFSPGDLYYREAEDNRVYRWDGTEWVDVHDKAMDQIAFDLANFQDDLTGEGGLLDSKATIFFQNNDPNSPSGTLGPYNTGDIWVHPTTRETKYWTGVGWELITDPKALDALSRVTGKITSYYLPNAPTLSDIQAPETQFREGDLWFKTPEMVLHRWDGSGWNDVHDRSIDGLATSLQDFQEELTGAGGLLDGLTEIYYQTSNPNSPAGTLGPKNQGDVWIHPTTNVLQSWDGSKWVKITDPEAIKALAEVRTRITTYYSASEPTAPTGGFTEGDMWVRSSDDKLHRWNGSTWVMLATATIGDIEDALNLVNNVSKSNHLRRWASNQEPLELKSGAFGGVNIPLMSLTSVGSPQIWSDWFPIDTSKAYEFHLWIRDTAALQGSGTPLYFGLHVADKNQSYVPQQKVSSTSGNLFAESTNNYFWSGSQSIGPWVEYRAYLLPYGTDPMDAIGLGLNVRDHVIITDPRSALARMRFLNYANNGTAREVLFAHMSVTETSIEAIRQGALNRRAILDVDTIAKDLRDNVVPGMGQDIVTAGGKFTASTKTPVNADGVGLPVNALWSKYDGNKLVGTWLWTGSSWTTRAPQEVHIDTGTYGDLDGARLTANSVLTKHLLVGSSENLIPNGGLETETKANWNPALALNTNVPPNTEWTRSIFNPSTTQGQENISLSEFWDIDPNREYLFEVWIKADKAGSVFYLELRDQSGAHAMSYSAVPGENFAGSSLYPLAGLTVPTTWTKYMAVCTAQNQGVKRIRGGNLFFNHSSGVQGAKVSIAGLRMRPRLGPVLISDGVIKAPHMDVDDFWNKTMRSQKITVDYLEVGSGINQIADPRFINDALRQERHSKSTMNGSWGYNAGENSTYYGSGSQPSSATLFFIKNNLLPLNNPDAYMPVSGGESWLFKCRVNITGGARLRLRLYKKDGTSSQYNTDYPAYTNYTAGLRWIEQAFTIPDDVVGVIPAVQMNTNATAGYIHEGPTLTRMTDASLVVEGSIYARHANIDDFYAKVVRSRKITADMLMIGQGENHIANPNFESLDGETAYGWSLTTGNSVAAAYGMNDARGLRVAGGSGQSGTYYGTTSVKDFSPRVAPGEPFRFACYVRPSANLAADFARIFVRWYKQSGTSWVTIESISAPALTANTWTKVEGTLTVPDGAAYASIGLYRQKTTSAAIDFSHPSMIRATDPSMVVDGILDANVVVGGTIGTALSGHRVEMKDDAVTSYEAYGFEMARMDGYGFTTWGGVYPNRYEAFNASQGGVTFRTGPSGDGIYIGSTSNSFADSQIRFESPGKAPMSISGIIDNTLPTIRVQAGSSGRFTAGGGDGTLIVGKHPNTAYSKDAYLYSGLGTSMMGFATDKSSAEMGLINEVGANMGKHTLRVDGSWVTSFLIYDGTGMGTTNVYIDSSGRLRRSTSTAEGKIGLEPLNNWEGIKSLEPVTFYDRKNLELMAQSIEKSDESILDEVEHLTKWIGLTAEQVEASGSGLATYDANGELNGVAYDRVAVALLPWLHELEERIKEIESREK